MGLKEHKISMAFRPNTAYLIGQRIGYNQNNLMNVCILSVVF